MKSERPITVSSTEYVSIAGVNNIPAKIDTGADSSAIWASHIDMKEDGTLVFVLFDEGSPLYTGQMLSTQEYTAKSVRSSHGDTQVRYRVKLDLKLKGKTINASFTLANRSKNHFPVLIGRRALKHNYIVDVSSSIVERPKSKNTKHLIEELKTNPHRFHQKYIERSHA